jgi:hypothetical protein
MRIKHNLVVGRLYMGHSGRKRRIVSVGDGVEVYQPGSDLGYVRYWKADNERAPVPLKTYGCRIKTFERWAKFESVRVKRKARV